MAMYNASLVGGSSVEIDGVAYDGDLKLKKCTRDVKLPSSPLQHSNGDMAIMGDTIHLLGDAKKHCSFDGQNWKIESDLPYNFTNGCCEVYKGELHILGGNGTSGTKQHYKWDGSTWTLASNMPIQPYYLGSLVENNEINIYWGTYHYKWNGSTWTLASNIPSNLISVRATKYKGSVHLLARYKNALNKVYDIHYKNLNGVWTEMEDLPYEPLAGSCCVSTSDKLYLIGGSEGIHQKNKYVYNDSSWEKDTDLPYFFKYGSVDILNDKLIIAGSSFYGTGGYNDDEVEVTYGDNVYILGQEIYEII